MKFPSIRCPQCDRVSYHPADIVQKYCGACHQFHDYMTVPIRMIPPAAAGADTKD